jgi:pimeloyl-ACP methyl ester carboxylesterase
MLFTERGFPIYYEDTGTGLPLILLPAFPFDGSMFSHQLPLAEHTRLIMPDYRGMGRSWIGPGPAGMRELADDTLALLDHLGIERAVWAGVSMGGYVALSVLASHPERVAGLALIDTRADADPPEAAPRRAETLVGLKECGTRSLQERLGSLFSPDTPGRDPEAIEHARAVLSVMDAEGLARITRGLAERPDRTGLLKAITVPTTVICGEHDTISPPALMKPLAEAIPGANFHLIQSAGHLSPLERPDLVNPILAILLERVAGTKAL